MHIYWISDGFCKLRVCVYRQMAQVLRRRHSLQRRPKGPLVRRFLELGPVVGPMARLARDTRTEDATQPDVEAAIQRITGERPGDLAMMMGLRDPSLEEWRRILHCCIMEANEAGQEFVEEPQVNISCLFRVFSWLRASHFDGDFFR